MGAYREPFTLKSETMVQANPENANRVLEEVSLKDLTDEQLVTAHLKGRPGAL